jgi:hypothetical protein
MSLTLCETAEGCQESVRLAADWIGKNLADQSIAPPTVITGDVIFAIQTNRPETQPHAVVSIFSDPPPPGLKDREADLRELVAAAPGFRSSFAIGPTNTGGGVTVLVADDKAAADAIRQRTREYVTTKYPEAVPTTPPRIIEGQAVKRIVGAAVTA